MKHYLITLHLRLGEYEKYTDVLIEAETEEQAKIEVLEGECHNEPDWEGYSVSKPDSLWDGMEFIYSVRKVQVVSDEDLKVLEKYFTVL